MLHQIIHLKVYGLLMQMEYQLLDRNDSDRTVVLECRTSDGKKVVLRDFDSAG